MHPGIVPRPGRLSVVNTADDPRPADYVAINRANWDSRVPHHEQGYTLRGAADDPRHLSSVVGRPAPPRRRHRTPRRHLQCHLGTDTLSLARLGPRMSGLDFSGPALAVAARLAAECGEQIDYVESDVYDATSVLPNEAFGLRLHRGQHAVLAARCGPLGEGGGPTLLKPGGFLFIREGPTDAVGDGGSASRRPRRGQYPYFETGGHRSSSRRRPMWSTRGTLASPTMVHFNHSLAEVLDSGCGWPFWPVALFEEHQSVPWNPLGDAMEEFEAR